MNQISSELLIEAKRCVIANARCGKLISPHEAWLLAGTAKGTQTLWSIARDLALEHEADAEELCAFLERQFPQYADTSNKPMSWDDIIHHGFG
jgi:hypothetical protein